VNDCLQSHAPNLAHVFAVRKAVSKGTFFRTTLKDTEHRRRFCALTCRALWFHACSALMTA
jgi:hypothetical protein